MTDKSHNSTCWFEAKRPALHKNKTALCLLRGFGLYSHPIALEHAIGEFKTMSRTNIPAVLSVRLPTPARDRLKVAAAARGETVQGLVGDLVERFLSEESRRPPDLAAVLGALRAAASNFRMRNVRALWVYGPVARGDAQPGATVELLVEFEPGARLSLIGLASLKADLSAALAAPVHLVERSSLPTAMLDLAERDGVRAL